MLPSRLVFLAGGAPFLILGTIHAFATPLTIKSRKGLSPRDPALSEAMSRSGVVLTSRTDVWRAWVGFNLSHSLGAVLFGAVVQLIGWSEPIYTLAASLAVPSAAVVAALYLVLGIKYWFRTPILGILFGLLCFVLSAVLGKFGY